MLFSSDTFHNPTFVATTVMTAFEILREMMYVDDAFVGAHNVSATIEAWEFSFC